MKVIIISGGSPPPKELLIKEISDDTFLISADSGANCLYLYNIKPNLLVGDFDSIDEKVMEYFIKNNCEIDVYPKEKDFTDTEIALRKGLSMKPSRNSTIGVHWK